MPVMIDVSQFYSLKMVFFFFFGDASTHTLLVGTLEFLGIWGSFQWPRFSRREIHGWPWKGREMD